MYNLDHVTGNLFFSGTGYLFSYKHLSGVLDEFKQYARVKAEGISKESLESQSVSDIIDDIYPKYHIEPLQIKRDEIYLARSNPENTKDLTFAVPFIGNPMLFHYKPSEYRTMLPQGYPNEKEKVLEFVISDIGTPEAVEGAVNAYMSELDWWLQRVNSEAQGYNQGVRSLMKAILERRIEDIGRGNDFLKALSYPTKRGEEVVKKIIPVERKPRPLEQKPVSGKSEKPKLEYELNQKVYDEILEDIQYMGTTIERNPKAFKAMGEEDIRWMFLVPLNAQYKGNASGETFNYSGKTDILISHDGKNLFIAECKIWKGKEVITDTVDQLLGYTTWRDTKTAILIFNRNKDLSNVLEQVRPAIESHDAFSNFVEQKSETEFRFQLRHPSDSKKILSLSVIVFDIPT